MGTGSQNTAFGPLSGTERRRLGRLAGVLMIVGSLTSIPAGLVLEPAPPAYEHLIGIGSALLGVATVFAPWERMSSNWLHLAMIAGILETAAGVRVFSDDFAFFYVLVAMYAAYVIRDRTVLIAYGAVIGLALVAPLAYASNDFKEQMHHILVTLPVLMISAVIVRYLRDTVEERERRYRGFAVEAVTLAERIRGGGSDEGNGATGDLRRRIGALAADADPEPDIRHR